MRLCVSVLVSLFVVIMLAGCNATKPYDNLDVLVRGDDIAVKDATLATNLGLLPVKDAMALYTADQTFVLLGLPPMIAAAQWQAAPVLDPQAVTLSQLNADIALLNSDLVELHKACTLSQTKQTKLLLQKK